MVEDADGYIWTGGSGSFGPYIFEENEIVVTVNCDSYVNVVDDFFILSNLHELNFGYEFQRDGATAHTAITDLREQYFGCLISLRGDF